MESSKANNFRWDSDRIPQEFDSAHLLHEYSPSIPHDFPPEFIPKNKCEVELLNLARCVMTVEEKLCGREYSDFLICKRERDLYLFDTIKKWESDVFREKTLEERMKYMKEIREKITSVEKEFESIPYLNLYKLKKHRFQSDLEQLNWRMEYLRKIM